jgi:2-keto-4-pentenoate hydratase/2-oxohepta-3-ene-1,7-dioic acid hydratase in catechol pathway
MRLVTFEREGVARLGALRGDLVVDLARCGSEAGIALPATMLALIDAGIEGLDAARRVLDVAPNRPGPGVYPLAEVRLLAPIPEPRRNVICLGRNYAEHARESSAARGQEAPPPAHPVYFTKATTAVIGPCDPIPYDAAISTQIDWEVELGVVIGRRGRAIPVERALEWVFGYMVINDVTARDLQSRHQQWFLGKSLDGSCPTGPCIVTADELPDPHALRLRLRVNGVTKQEATTADLIFNVNACIATLARGTTLLPGDIIATGTPAGVGFARTPPEFLKPGDLVEAEIEGIGMLRNPVVEASVQER